MQSTNPLVNRKERRKPTSGGGKSGAYSLRYALRAQLGGLLAVLLLVVALVRLALIDPAGIALVLAMLQGGIAAIIATRQHAPFWWLIIHLGFAPLVIVMHGLSIAPGWYLGGFLLLLAVFGRTDQSRVPLYLSNRATGETLLGMLPKSPCQVLDLGCGDGGLLRRLAVARPDCQFTGIEHAPLPWLLARVVTLSLPNVTVRRGDFWQIPLVGYDLVYAFLSPAPMTRLWEKAQDEMAPGALLVSNSFEVPDIVPERIVQVGDRRETHLLCYRPNKTTESAAIPAISTGTDQE